MNNLIKLVRELLEKVFSINEVSILENGELGYHLSGFYKSGHVILHEDNNFIYALARYDEITILNDDETPFDSLVMLNYDWWKRSKGKYEGWANPDPLWLPYFIDKGLVKEKITITYE